MINLCIFPSFLSVRNTPSCRSRWTISVSKSTPLAVTGPYGQLASFWFLTHVIPVILCEAKLSAGNIIDPHDSLNIPKNHKLKSPFSSNSQDLSALCPVESVTYPFKYPMPLYRNGTCPSIMWSNVSWLLPSLSDHLRHNKVPNLSYVKPPGQPQSNTGNCHRSRCYRNAEKWAHGMICPQEICSLCRTCIGDFNVLFLFIHLLQLLPVVKCNNLLNMVV